MRARTWCSHTRQPGTQLRPGSAGREGGRAAGPCPHDHSQRRIGWCNTNGRPSRAATTTITSERENPMPDQRTPPDHTHDREFPDVVAEFGGTTDPNGIYHEPDDPHEDAEPADPDDADLEFECGGAGIGYHCTRRELREAGYGGGFSVGVLDEMPEHDSEFMAPAVVTDPLDYTEAPYGHKLRALLDSVDRWDWSELPGFHRLAAVLTSEYMDPRLFEIGL